MTEIMNFVTMILAWVNTFVSSIRGKVTEAVTDENGEAYVDTGVKILIAVVIGALLLAGLYALFNTTIMPTVTQKVVGLFDYAG